jgi:hypothetical protein
MGANGFENRPLVTKLSPTKENETMYPLGISMHARMQFALEREMVPS